MPDEEPVTQTLDLLYPFYLDADMSMAFAAAVAGGVALEREDTAYEQQESEAVRNLRGNLRLFGAVGGGGERDRRETESVVTESRFVRRHTEASIFISLYDELRRRGQIAEGADAEIAEAGSLAAMRLGPAVAPLRRVVDQLVRLIDVASPIMAASVESVDKQVQSQVGGGQRRKPPGGGGRAKSDKRLSDEEIALQRLRSLLVALQDDLDRSGMVDLVVRREGAADVVLTLDKRFLSDQALELLHTSSFVVIGKVTQRWPGEDEFVNLLRRSVMSLVPALAQTLIWNIFGLLAILAASANPAEAQKAAAAVAGLAPPAGVDEPTELMLGEDVNALNPGVQGPAFQILPLAVCA